MAKSKNFKSHDIRSEKSSVIKLKSIMNEVKASQLRSVNKIGKNASINENALQAILSSGFLNKRQSEALSLYFEHHGITSINESVVRRIDKDIINLNEGIFDIAKKVVDKAKEVGGKVVGAVTNFGKQYIDAFKVGWNAVKKIWDNFKDLVLELVEKIKNSIKKIYEAAMAKINQIASKLSSKLSGTFLGTFIEEHPHEPTDLAKEFGQLTKVVNHLASAQKSIVDGELYEKTMVDGSFTPEDASGIKDEKEIEGDFAELATESYMRVFSNRNYLKQLHEITLNPLNEGGHIEDHFKNNKVVYYIIKWGMFAFKAVFSPFSLIASKIGSFMIGKGLLKGTSWVSNKYKNGPGVYEFAILTLLIGEVLEIIEEVSSFVSADHLGVIASLVKPFLGVLGPLLDIGMAALHVCHIIIVAWAIATVINNLLPLFQKAHKEKGKEMEAGGEEGGEEGGGEPEVQTAGYKPRGSFKLKEGKLIFVQ